MARQIIASNVSTRGPMDNKTSWSIRRAKNFTIKFNAIDLYFSSLIFVIIVSINCEHLAAESAEVVAPSSNNVRKWSNGVGLWGKRSPIPPSAYANGDAEDAKFLSKRPEHSWDKLNSLWGKRSSSWQAANGLWGKRSQLPLLSPEEKRLIYLRSFLPLHPQLIFS